MESQSPQLPLQEVLVLSSLISIVQVIGVKPERLAGKQTSQLRPILLGGQQSSALAHYNISPMETKAILSVRLLRPLFNCQKLKLRELHAQLLKTQHMMPHDFSCPAVGFKVDLLLHEIS